MKEVIFLRLSENNFLFSGSLPENNLFHKESWLRPWTQEHLNFLDNDDYETGEGDQDQEEVSRTPMQPAKKMMMSAALTEKSMNSISHVVFSYFWCMLI